LRTSLGFIGLIALAAAQLGAQDSTHVFCRQSACAVMFDWSNGSTPPDPDRRYGAPSELEAAFRSRLTAAGYKVAASQPASATITVRLTPQTRALCDAMEGMNPDYSCHTVARATIVFSSSEPNAAPTARVDVNPRCADPKLSMTMAKFGEYAADLVVFTLAPDPKPGRPNTRC
jgi:hypothetical protein